MKRIILCADDFGQSPAIDRGILALADAARLSAVSCMVQGEAWRDDAPSLLAHAAGIAVGLHVNLTHPFPEALSVPHAALIGRCYAGAIDRAALERTLDAQLDAFERIAGRAPAFVDGHQHVHQLPVVRDVLLERLASRYPAVPGVRTTVPLRYRGAKALIVATLGGYAMRRALDREAIRHNTDFAGVYALKPGQGYADRMRRWLADIADGGMIVCHPGEAAAVGDSDPIGAARVEELRHLQSPDFATACIDAQVTLSGFP
jgi:predicted glycoside hydrolase/deacetylase ChbG (UPF0249 family)